MRGKLEDVAVKSLDTGHTVSKQTQNYTFVSYRGERISEGIFKLLLIVSLFPSDHSLHYFFIKGSTTEEAFRSFAKFNYDFFGDNFVVVETGETFQTDYEVEYRALSIKKGLPNANVYTPAITITDPKEVLNV